VPGGRARRAAIVPTHARFAPTRRGLAVPDGRLTRPGESPHGFVVSCGDRAGGAGTRTPQPRQVEVSDHGIYSVCLILLLLITADVSSVL
jgi:hypothetical protein